MIKEFIERLKEELNKRNYSDVDEIISYFDELIKDRMDNGETEEDIIRDLEDPSVIASSLVSEADTDSFASILKDFDDLKDSINKEGNTYSFDNINDLDIDLVSANLEVFASSVDKTKVTVTGKYASKITVEKDSDCLKIEQKNIKLNLGWPFFKASISSFVDDTKVIVELPYTEYDELDIENVSGETKLMDISFNEADLESVSGTIEMVNCQFERVAIESVSGVISSNSLRIQNELEVESVSGLVELNYLVADEISIETVSGNINLLLEGDSDDYCIHTEKIMDEQYIDNGGFRTLEIETVSGYINYSFIE
jgi:DUF4097 and DUF4098 domain-containing protein YvlB